MSTRPSRSKEVIEDYKKHKLTRSALRHIQDLLQVFDQERAFDRKLAWVGMLFVIFLVAISLYWLSNSTSIILR